MRTLLRLAALSAAVLAGGPALAQKDPGPAIEVRLRSVNDLVEKVEYLGDVVNQAEAAKQAAGFVKSLADEKKGIEGVDPARPFGLYGFVTKDVVDSPVVLMVPLADEAAFLDLLKSKIGLEPKKGDGGVYEVRVPNVPAPVFFRFANEYVYATVNDAGHLDKENLLTPKAFFATKDDAILSARLHLDRLPADVKKTVFGQFELQLADAKTAQQPGETPAQHKLRGWALDQLAGTVNRVLTDGTDLTVRLLVEPKTDDLTAEVTFTAKDGSPLGKVIRGLEGRTATAAALAAGAGSSLAKGGVKVGLPDDAKKDLGPLVDVLVKEAVENVKEGVERQAAKLVIDAITPTLKAGELDAGFIVTGPDDQGRATLLAGLKVVEGGKIEKTIKQFGPFVPENQAKFEFDVEKVGGLALHKVTVSDETVEQAFGTKTVWLATGEDRVLLSIEPDGTAIRAAAKREAGKAPVLAAEVSVVRAVAVAEKGLPADKLKELAKEAFGAAGPAAQDTVRLDVTGGKALTIRFTAKGKAVKYGVLIDQAKKP
jgi:hypothetical protein